MRKTKLCEETEAAIDRSSVKKWSEKIQQNP